MTGAPWGDHFARQLLPWFAATLLLGSALTALALWCFGA